MQVYCQHDGDLLSAVGEEEQEIAFCLIFIFDVLSAIRTDIANIRFTWVPFCKI